MVLGIAGSGRYRSYLAAAITKIPDICSCISDLVGKRYVEWKTSCCIIRHTADSRHYIGTDTGKVKGYFNHAQVTVCRWRFGRCPRTRSCRKYRPAAAIRTDRLVDYPVLIETARTAIDVIGIPS